MHAYLRSLALGLALLLPAVPAFAADAPAKTDAAIPDKPTRITERNTPVAVEYEGNDSIGSRLATRVKETLNSSNLFSLTDKDTPKIRILIATQPEFKDRPGVGSAYAVVWVFSQSENILRHYLTREVGVVTPDEINGWPPSLLKKPTASLPGTGTCSSNRSIRGHERHHAGIQRRLPASCKRRRRNIRRGSGHAVHLGTRHARLHHPRRAAGLSAWLHPLPGPQHAPHPRGYGPLFPHCRAWPAGLSPACPGKGRSPISSCCSPCPASPSGWPCSASPSSSPTPALPWNRPTGCLPPRSARSARGRGQLLFSTVRELRFHLLTACITAFGRVVSEVGISMLVGGNIKWATGPSLPRSRSKRAKATMPAALRSASCS